ncbi:MAG TPA: DUF11 domain-containing protein [Rhodanobacteraceae bacterium]|nr:DUF11 domain-containing protein [Rhodanobacteraceae bacterium]
MQSRHIGSTNGNSPRAGGIWLLSAGVSILTTALLTGDVVSSLRAESVATTARIALDAEASRAALDPGTSVTYTITLSNRGGADAAGARLVDPLPAGTDSARWTCAAEGGASCARNAGTGGIDEPITHLPGGGLLRYTLDASVARRPPPHIRNPIRVELPADATCADRQTPPCETRVDLAAGPRVVVETRASNAAPAPGQSFVYNLTIRNAGTVDAGGTVVRDPMPVGLAQFDWTCSGSAPCPRTSGSGSLLETLAHFPPGSSLTYTIQAKPVADPPERITHTATANPPWGGSCGEGDAIHAPPCVATTISPADSGQCGTAGSAVCRPASAPAPDGTVPQLTVSKFNLNGAAGPGDGALYIVNVGNNASAATADSVMFTDDPPPGIASFDSWTCLASGGSAVCPNASGTGPINETLVLPALSELQYTVNATVGPAPPTYITNVASVTAPVGTAVCAADGSQPPCTGSDVMPTVPVIGVFQAEGGPGVNPADGGIGVFDAPPGSPVMYTLIVQNEGLTISGSLTIEDPVPQGLVNVTWTCFAQPPDGVASTQGFGQCPAASGAGDIDAIVAGLAHNGGLIYTIQATVSADPPGAITNVATVTPPNGSICEDGTAPPCTAELTFYTRPTVAVTKTADATQLVPGGVVTYTVTVSNSGSDGSGTVFSDPVPAGIDQVFWTCNAFGGAQCGGINGSGDITDSYSPFPPGGQVVYTLDAQVSQDATGSVTNTATVVFVPTNGVCNPASCVAAVTLPVAPVPTANLTVTKTADVSEAIPGQPVTYTITVSNIGAAAAIDTVLSDPLPAGLSGFSWSCTSSTGECPNPAGSGDIDETIPMLTGEVRYQAVAQVAPQPPATITNIATITPVNGATCDQSVCTATSSIPTGMPGAAAISVVKATDNTQAIPGGQVLYNIRVSNDGDTATAAVTVTDPIPTGLSAFSWTCNADGAVCPSTSGNGAINQTLSTLPPFSVVIYDVTATVSPTPPPDVINRVTATPSDGVGCTGTSCEASVTLPTGTTGAPQITVTKTTQSTQLLPGGQVQYAVQVLNGGAVDAGAILVSDPVPAGLTGFSWTCAGAACPATSGSGSINEPLGTLPAGTSVNYAIFATVGANPPSSVTNTATATPSDGTGCTATSCSSSVTLPVVTPDLLLTKTVFGSNVSPGGTVHYTVTLANNGDGDAGAILVSDPVPSGLTPFTWVCSGADCPASSGSGAINETLAGLPAGAQVVYTTTAVVVANPPPTITNTATATPSDGTGCSGTNCTSSVTLTVVPAGTPSIVVTKTADVGTASPGGTVVYTVTVANQGDGDAAAITVSDPLPAGVTAFTWTCSGLNCPAASGSGAVNETLAGLPAGALVTYAITATLAANPPASVTNTATATPSDGAGCSGTSCTDAVTVTVSTPSNPMVRVSKTADVPNGAPVQPGQPIEWTVAVRNNGTATQGTVMLTDVLPTGIADVVVDADAGVQCDATHPAPGQRLVCSIPPGFTGSRRIVIGATIATDSGEELHNSVTASGQDAPQCTSCSTTNPVVPGGDVALGNPRPFVAAGTEGALFDVVNLAAAVPVTIAVEPAASVVLLAAYAAECTADDGEGGNVVVVCPDPPPMQGVHCDAASCSIDNLPQGATMTFFVAPEGASTLTVHAGLVGDANPDDNSLVIPPPAGAP